MPEPALAAVELAPFAVRYTDAAREARKLLPESYLPALLDAIDDLSTDPLRYPQRTRNLYQDIFLYRHPAPALEITFQINNDAGELKLLHFVASALITRRNVFISYSHQDAEWLVKIKKWLVTLEREDRLRLWDDTLIQPGAHWREEIQKNLQAASVALLLVTQDFIASDFIDKNELPPLLDAEREKGLKILCVAVGLSAHEGLKIAEFQWVNKPDEPLSKAVDLEQDLRKVYEAVKKAAGG